MAIIEAFYYRMHKFYPPYLYGQIAIFLAFTIIFCRVFFQEQCNISDALMSSAFNFILACFGVWSLQATVQRYHDIHAPKSGGQNDTRAQTDKKYLTGE